MDALNKKNPVELRARMFAELAQYVAPKRKALDPTRAAINPHVQGNICQPTCVLESNGRSGWLNIRRRKPTALPNRATRARAL